MAARAPTQRLAAFENSRAGMRSRSAKAKGRKRLAQVAPRELNPMQLRGLIAWVATVSLLASARAEPAESGSAGTSDPAMARTFPARGVVKELNADGHSVTIRHEAISNYMAAMTMPFNVRTPAELAGLQAGDEIAFQLHVTDSESWIDHVVKLGVARIAAAQAPAHPAAAAPAPVPSRHPLLDYPFTNELGQAVTLGQFRGQALAITFFFTRCPIPDYCPRLSRNFEEASQKLSAMTHGPTNWHFLSVTFDPENDTPPVLKAYAERYHYDSKRWNFLTGPADKIIELARSSGITIDREGPMINHNFRTLIIDANGHLQTTYPFGGNLSQAIVAEMLKAAAVPVNGLAAAQAAAGTTPMTTSASRPPADRVAR